MRAWLSYVSPHYGRSDLGPAATDELKVLVFADRVWGWQLDVAERLVKTDEQSGFAVLGIVMSYFEMIGKHLRGFEGMGESAIHFRVGFDSAFPDVPKDQADRIADRLYKSVRNGLYHDAITSAGIALTRRKDDPPRVLYETPGMDGMREIVINPELLTSHIRRHFASYVAGLLRDPDGETRKGFVKRFTWVDSAGAAASSPTSVQEAVQEAGPDEDG